MRMSDQDRVREKKKEIERDIQTDKEKKVTDKMHYWYQLWCGEGISRSCMGFLNVTVTPSDEWSMKLRLANFFDKCHVHILDIL